jgi:HEPN domain-containing protein
MPQTSRDYQAQLVGYVSQAMNRIRSAEGLLQQGYYAGCVQDSQHAIEFLAKCVFLVQGRPYPKEHKIPEDEFLDAIMGLPPEAKNLPLARLYLLHVFWFNFYSQAKYGLETLTAPAETLFQKAEAELALKHAQEWQGAIIGLRRMTGT